MKALVFKGINQIAWENVPEPKLIADDDAIVAVEGFTFSRQDFRPYLGEDHTVSVNRIMGHEAVGTIIAVGKNVKNFKINDRVVVNCMSSCGTCLNCLQKRVCTKYGFCLGVSIDGTHAEYVRVIGADYSMWKIPSDLPLSSAILLSDVLATAYENVILKLNNRQIHNAAIIGDGPIGMGILSLLKYFTKSKISVLGHHNEKLNLAHMFGADETYLTKNSVLTDNLNHNFDLVVECVGGNKNFSSFTLAETLLANDGLLTLVGVFKTPVVFNLNDLWFRSVTIKTGILTNRFTEPLIDLISNQKLNLNGLISVEYNANEVLKGFTSVLTNRGLQKVLINLKKLS